MLGIIAMIYLLAGFYYGCAFGDSAWEVIQYMFLWLPNIIAFLYYWFSAKNIDKIEE